MKKLLREIVSAITLFCLLGGSLFISALCGIARLEKTLIKEASASAYYHYQNNHPDIITDLPGSDQPRISI